MSLFDGISAIWGGGSESSSDSKITRKVETDEDVSIIKKTWDEAKKEYSTGYGRMVKNYDKEGATPAVLDGIATTVHLANKPFECTEKYIEKGAKALKTDIDIVDNLGSDGIGEAGTGIAEVATGLVDTVGSTFSAFTDSKSLDKATSKVGAGLAKTCKGGANFLLAFTGKGLLWGKKEDETKISEKKQIAENIAPNEHEEKSEKPVDVVNEPKQELSENDAPKTASLLDRLAEECGVIPERTPAIKDETSTPVSQNQTLESYQIEETNIPQSDEQENMVKQPVEIDDNGEVEQATSFGQLTRDVINRKTTEDKTTTSDVKVESKDEPEQPVVKKEPEAFKQPTDEVLRTEENSKKTATQSDLDKLLKDLEAESKSSKAKVEIPVKQDDIKFLLKNVDEIGLQTLGNITKPKDEVLPMEESGKKPVIQEDLAALLRDLDAETTSPQTKTVISRDTKEDAEAIMKYCEDNK